MTESSEELTYKVKITTEIIDGIIVQTAESSRANIIFDLQLTVVDVKEEQMKQALISLGWTPPDE